MKAEMAAAPGSGDTKEVQILCFFFNDAVMLV